MNVVRSRLTRALAIVLTLAATRIALAQTADGAQPGDRHNFGPCECQPRKTLFQWSYGTSFDGGPSAWDEPLVSDRPDFTEASVTVGRGVSQLEMGYTYVHDSDGGPTVHSYSYPETLLRVGLLAEWLELRVFWNYANERTAGLTTGGAEDLGLGAKIALTPQEGCLPEMALIAEMSVPTGSRAFGNPEVLPGAVWLYSWKVNDWITTGGQTGMHKTLDPVTGAAYGEFLQSWTIAYSLTDHWGAYTEYFGIIPDGADTARSQHYFDGGFTYLVTNNIQLDVRGGVGLNQGADDFFLGTGAVLRF